MPDAFPRLSQRTVLRALRTQLRAVLVAAAIASIVSAAPAVATSRVFRVYIENNLPEPVIVRDCDSYCSSAPIDLYLAPGVKAPINRITNDHKFFSVTSDGGSIWAASICSSPLQPRARRFPLRAPWTAPVRTSRGH